MKSCWKFTHPKAIQDEDEFVSSETDFEKCSITSLAHQWILCSEWVPSEWKSKQMIKTSQWSTSNPHDCSPSINVKICFFVCLFFCKTNQLRHFLLQLVILSESGEKYAQIKHRLQVKPFTLFHATCWVSTRDRWICSWNGCKCYLLLLKSS